MEKIEISNINLEELEVKLKQWIREVLQETGKGNQASEKLMDANETADYLGMKVGTLYKKTASCEIPHIKRGKKLLFEKAALDSWLNSKRKELNKEAIEISTQRSLIRQIRNRSTNF